MSSRSDVLLVGQTPPPYHGQAVVTAMLFDHDWGNLKVERLRMAYSDSIDAVGKVGLFKALHLLFLILQTWKIALINSPEILYYLPASANKVPVFRDAIYLALVRWCFPKTVFHYHAGGLPEYLMSAGWLGKMALKIYSAADLSVEICKTEFSPGKIFDADETVYIPNGLDVELLPRARPEGAVFRALFLGALNEGKGVLDVIRSAKLTRANNCKIEYMLVGSWSSDQFRNEAEALVTNEQLEDIIKFTGPLKGDDKWQAYADADIFIFPSHYQSENFPLVLIEAMAFGLPLVSTSWRGIPQLVGESGAAILCDINAPDQYAEAIQTLYANVGFRDEMANAAVSHYDSNYTRHQFVSAMEDAFQSVLSIR